MRPVDHVLRVFTDEEGRFGNFLGVFLDTADWSDAFCQSRAHDLGFSETVFIDDLDTGRIRIFTPTVKLGFAGHPTVGAAWLIDHLGHERHDLHCDVGTVYTVATRVGATVLADPAWCPPIALRQVPSPTDVLSHSPTGNTSPADDPSSTDDPSPTAPHSPTDHPSPTGDTAEYVWAWVDEPAGLVRARAFVGSVGIPEDEATGSAAILLAAHLDRAIHIQQGIGSELHVGLTNHGKAALSGNVSLDS